MRRLKLAMAGLGQGAAESLPALAAMPEIELVAGADADPAMRAGFAERYPGTRVHASVADLARDREVDVVWIATPNRFHAEHAIEVMRSGKHAIVEKPLAITLAETDAMIAAAKSAGVLLLAAHTRSLSIWYRAMRRIALSGTIGAVRAIHVTAYSDWILRARTADELDPEEGGGIVYRQGPHQLDTVRLLGGGRLRSVRAMTGRWLDQRPIPGYYTAFLEFEDGTPATVMHNGYGYFTTPSLFPWSTDKRGTDDVKRIALRRALIAGERDEDREKAEFRVGGRQDPTARVDDVAPVPYPWKPFSLGVVEVACERGVIRPAQWGLTLHDDNGSRELDLRSLQRTEPDPSGGLTIAIVEELYAAVVNGRPVYHDGAWGAATLEVTLAVMESAEQRQEIFLERQVAMPADYDAAMPLDLILSR